MIEGEPVDEAVPVEEAKPADETLPAEEAQTVQDDPFEVTEREKAHQNAKEEEKVDEVTEREKAHQNAEEEENVDEVTEREKAHQWAEAHGHHHKPLRAERMHVLEEQEHTKSQGGSASEIIRPNSRGVLVYTPAGKEDCGERRVRKKLIPMRHGMRGTLTTFPSAARRPDANPILDRKVIARAWLARCAVSMLRLP